MKNQLDISIVYLGNNLPRYLIKNLIYLKLTFPNEKFVFISDNEASLNKVKKIGVEIWKFNSLATYQEKYQGLLEHDYEFRSNFWFNSLARFFAIFEYMREKSENPHLHLEADNFLFSNFPFDYFRENFDKTAFPLAAKDLGVASILFLPHLESAQKLVDYSISQIRRNSKSTDMTILGSMASSNDYETLNINVLPLEIGKRLIDNSDLNLFSLDLGLDGIFDASTHGQYLLGLDPRNYRGMRKVYNSSISTAFDVSELDYQYDLSHDFLQICCEGKIFPIYNLHNHSKDERIYTSHSRKRLLLRRVRENRGKSKSEFVIWIYFVLLIGFGKRRLKLLRKKLTIV